MLIQRSNVSFSQTHQFHRIEQSSVMEQRLRTRPEATPQENSIQLSTAQQDRTRQDSAQENRRPPEQRPPSLQRVEHNVYTKPRFSHENLTQGGSVSPLNEEQALDHRLLLIKAMVAAINGDSTKFSDFNPRINTESVNAERATFNVHTESFQSIELSIEGADIFDLANGTFLNPENRGALVVENTIVHSTREYEASSVGITSQLQTSDGRSLDINIHQHMERSYVEQSVEIRVERVQLKDPLVINLGGENLQLSAEQTRFDIDSDGDQESIARISSNSAYIALDRNEDGVINNGSELFGAQSGNGFAELAIFDEDGNGFIDDGDSVFSQLQAYRPGDGSLQSLKELGVGALSLSSVDSPFRITDEQNQTLAQVRATGFAVMEDGSSNTLQQIDLAV